jgi:peptidoglycan/xylan/chitin deacetylase (PgdA/CDA1 family)
MTTQSARQPSLQIPAIASTVGDPPSHELLYERYLGSRRRSRLLSAYYRIKPWIPRFVQLQFRRAYARRQATRSFPAWPVESTLLKRRDEQLRARLHDQGLRRVPVVGWWPDGASSACVLTHDVEGEAGVENIGRVLEVEQRHGFVSSWNFVAEWYPIPDGLFDRLRASGCEIGLHGIKHDGRLFESRSQFESNLPKIHRYMQDWDAVGFRSPATHRRSEWMPELNCLYDTSFPDTDPFEPQPGGCCSIFPFMVEDLVELPITLVQDHTMWEILRQSRIDMWVQKSLWIMRNHGLVNLITHPDYLLQPERLAMYEEFLVFLKRQEGCWRALPREVAEWWRLRERLNCVLTADGAEILGDDSGRARIAWAEAAEGEMRFEL